MREHWPGWAREAWRNLSGEQRERARAVWTTLAEAYGGVLVGPGPLVRHLVDAGQMGHRSTMDTIARLVGEDLLHARRAAEGLVLWVPDELMVDTDEARDRPRARFAATRDANGAGASPRARA